MHELFIRGKRGSFFRVTFDEIIGFPNETSIWGGYDVNGTVEIKSGNYYVKGELWFSTGEIYEFHQQLIRCWSELNGSASFRPSADRCLELIVVFNNRGQVILEGTYTEFASEQNELKFEFESDQGFYEETNDMLLTITKHYGGLKGVRKD
ncbi:hypothetical protein GOM71_17590 [Paenibacillus sp. NEAU-GSW1]|nr:hypothetical protein [Paenibacillus sp. NEAU-GSW1]